MAIEARSLLFIHGCYPYCLVIDIMALLLFSHETWYILKNYFIPVMSLRIIILTED